MRLNECAVCGNQNYVGFELCKNCWSEWTITGTMPKPEWLKWLIKNEYSFQTNYSSTRETPFTDLLPEDDEQKTDDLPKIVSHLVLTIS